MSSIALSGATSSGPRLRADLTIVEQVFRRDLELLGYRFGEPAPTNALWIEDGRVRESTAATRAAA